MGETVRIGGQWFIPIGDVRLGPYEDRGTALEEAELLRRFVVRTSREGKGEMLPESLSQ